MQKKLNAGSKDLSERFKQLREKLNLTQTEMAEMMGYGANAEAAIENRGHGPSEEFIDCICSTYHVNKQWLLTGEGEMLLDENGKQNEVQERRNANIRLKQLRKENGCTMEQFGKKTGISKTAYWMIESGRRVISDRLAKKICDACHVGTGWLLYGYEDEKEYPLDEEMIAYLKRNPEKRKIVRGWMRKS